MSEHSKFVKENYDKLPVAEMSKQLKITRYKVQAIINNLKNNNYLLNSYKERKVFTQAQRDFVNANYDKMKARAIAEEIGISIADVYNIYHTKQRKNSKNEKTN